MLGHLARLVRKVFGQFWDQILYRSRAARDCRIVLDIIRRELLQDTWVPIDERAGQCAKGNLLIGLHQNLLIYLSASECVELDFSSQARLATENGAGLCRARHLADDHGHVRVYFSDASYRERNARRRK